MRKISFVQRIASIKKLQFITLITVLFTFLFSGCSYNYYRGQELEAEKRFEEANIEYHRAYVQSPGSTDYKEAFLRTSKLTVEEFLLRYKIYLIEKKHALAYSLLTHAKVLQPKNETVNSELQKWERVLISGKVDLQFKTLRNQFPLAEEMELEIHFNTSNPSKRLIGTIDHKTGTFSVEDVLYEPPQNLLMFYSINSIGVKTKSNFGRETRFRKFINLGIPVLYDVKGNLASKGNGLKGVEKLYPIQSLKAANSTDPWLPSRGVRYSLVLDEDKIQVESSSGTIDFLPMMLYINREDRRIFLDFGNLILSQDANGGRWSLNRIVTEDRSYFTDLKKQLILNPYFYFREGGYPFVKILG